MIFSVDFFQILPFWEAFCFHYNRDPSMKNTENNTMTAGCDNFKTSSLTIGMQLVQITRFIASRIAENRFRAGGPPYPGLMAHYS
jgi:hypothetical protein